MVAAAVGRGRPKTWLGDEMGRMSRRRAPRAGDPDTSQDGAVLTRRHLQMELRRRSRQDRVW